ncbi:MAG: ATP phosphoribosyltransferase [Clostridia bacterium]|nr:ATP phosphoribosyltransferase [Clostridia bacterium]MCD8309028.1 ATP phosphoribosyltransferase [Clostridia bacterium]
MLNVALPKGRLGEKVYKMLERAGYSCKDVLSDSRKLIFTDEQNGVSYFWVKPSDVAIYVERGVADIGVAGKDILAESGADIYELLDLGIGKCKMAVASVNGYREDISRPLRVATKFPRIAAAYYGGKNREIDIIKLYGSIELAPILGLSDVIVDIVETGTTLKENNMSVIADIFPISARLIANKACYKFKGEEIDAAVERLKKELPV